MTTPMITITRMAIIITATGIITTTMIMTMITTTSINTQQHETTTSRFRIFFAKIGATRRKM